MALHLSSLVSWSSSDIIVILIKCGITMDSIRVWKEYCISTDLVGKEVDLDGGESSTLREWVESENVSSRYQRNGKQIVKAWKE